MYKDFILILIRVFKPNVYLMIFRKILIIILLLPSVLLAEKNTEWYYKTYLENNTEMTTAFIKYDENLKNHVQEFLKNKEVKVITKSDNYVAITIPVYLIKKQINKWGENVEIYGLRDDNTYLQEKRIDKLLLDWTSEEKGMLKGFCHVDSIYIVSVIFKHPETKRRYTVESFFTESNGEFSCWLPEGKYKISVKTVKSYMVSEKQKKKILKDVDVKELKFAPFNAKYEPKVEPQIINISDINGWVLKEGSWISHPIEIINNTVTLVNIPMYTYFDYGTERKTIIDYKIKFYEEKENYPYLYYFYQLLPLDDCEKTFEKPDEKINISGIVKLVSYEDQAFELSFLSAKHHLTYIQTDSLGYFSAEVYPDIYAVTIVSLPRIKTDVKDIMVNSYKESDFKLEFTVVDSLPAGSFPAFKVFLHQRYNYFTKSFKDLKYDSIKSLR